MSKMQKIDEVSDSTITDFFQSIDTVLFDIDGVLVHNRAVIPGSEDAVRKLRAMGKNVGFVTNNTIYELDRLVNNMRPFEAKLSEMFSPISALLHYLKQSHPKDKDIYVVTNSVPVRLLKQAGYNIIEYKDIHSARLGETITDLVNFAFNALKKCTNVGLVFVDTDLNVSHGALQVAQLILNHNPDVKLVFGMADDLAPLGDNIAVVCAKYYIDAIQRWTKRSGISVAKPSEVLAELINTRFNVTDPGRVLIVGDNVDTDIAFGVQAGYKTVLVLSGICSREQVDNWEFADQWKPDLVAENLGDLCAKLK